MLNVRGFKVFDSLHNLSVAPEETNIEESCLEESSVEPDQDDDSIRVKIADLGNACWVVSVAEENSDEKVVASSETSLHFDFIFHLHKEMLFDCCKTDVAQMMACWPESKLFHVLPFHSKQRLISYQTFIKYLFAFYMILVYVSITELK